VLFQQVIRTSVRCSTSWILSALAKPSDPQDWGASCSVTSC